MISIGVLFVINIFLPPLSDLPPFGNKMRGPHNTKPPVGCALCRETAPDLHHHHQDPSLHIHTHPTLTTHLHNAHLAVFLSDDIVGVRETPPLRQRSRTLIPDAPPHIAPSGALSQALCPADLPVHPSPLFSCTYPAFDRLATGLSHMLLEVCALLVRAQLALPRTVIRTTWEVGILFLA